MRRVVFSVLLFCMSCGTLQAGEVLLGDIDNFSYEGSVDWVYVDPGWQSDIYNLSSQATAGFDSLAPDSSRSFTFEFDLQGCQVVSAILEIGVIAVADDTGNDVILFDEVTNNYMLGNSGLNILPIPETIRTVWEFDLSNVLGDDLTGLLNDGQFNVMIADDIAVDYAKLTYCIPEPSTIFILGLGGLALVRYRKAAK